MNHSNEMQHPKARIRINVDWRRRVAEQTPNRYVVVVHYNSLVHLSYSSADYIDLFLIHAPYPGKELRLATYKALQEAMQAGKIRSVGVSN
jgi:aryl-alcohol dehydrogenase-like predicted oxidoreductase